MVMSVCQIFVVIQSALFSLTQLHLFQSALRGLVRQKEQHFMWYDTEILCECGCLASEDKGICICDPGLDFDDTALDKRPGCCDCGNPSSVYDGEEVCMLHARFKKLKESSV